MNTVCRIQLEELYIEMQNTLTFYYTSFDCAWLSGLLFRLWYIFELLRLKGNTFRTTLLHDLVIWYLRINYACKNTERIPHLSIIYVPAKDNVVSKGFSSWQWKTLTTSYHIWSTFFCIWQWKTFTTSYPSWSTLGRYLSFGGNLKSTILCR